MKVLELLIFGAITLFTFGVANITLAQNNVDPIIGTWELNHQKSLFREGIPNYPPQQETESYTLLESGFIHRTLQRLTADGTSITNSMTWPASGGIAEFEQGVTPTFIETKIAQGEWYVTAMSEGVQIQTIHKLVSADQQTMRQTIRRFRDGEKFETVHVFDRK